MEVCQFLESIVLNYLVILRLFHENNDLKFLTKDCTLIVTSVCFDSNGLL